jgi:transposase-like protein
MRLCVNNQTAFGGMLQQLVELTSIVLRPEPLDAEIERRCKQAWKEAPCPDCGETTINAGDSSPRLWCSNCRYTFTYTRNTPFEGRTLTPGEVIIAFVLYADTLLSINQVAQLFEAVYDTVHTTIREVNRLGVKPRGTRSAPPVELRSWWAAESLQSTA